MNKPPASFLTLCRIARLSKPEAEKEWQAVWRRTIQNFLEYLFTEASLKKNEKEKLTSALEKLAKKEIKKNIFELTWPLFSSTAQKKALLRFSRFYYQQIERSLNQLQAKLAYEEKQIWKAYLEAKLNHE